MNKFEGTITLEVHNGQAMLKGFTRNDFNFLMKLARKQYRIKSTKKRILKKYVSKLLNGIISNYVTELPAVSAAP